MKKRIALPITIASGVIAALLISVLVMSFIFVNPLKDMTDGYDYVRVYDKSQTNAYPVGTEGDDEVKKAFGETGFSVMQSILEGRFGLSPNFKLVDKEGTTTGEKERVNYNMIQIMAVAADADNYMLEFAFKDKKTLKIEGEEVAYDRLKVLVHDTNGEIKKIEAIPYLYEKISTNNDDRLYYTAPVVEMYLMTSKLVPVLDKFDEFIK